MNLRNLFTELKRRNVYRIAVAYAVVGWLLIQVATQVFPFFEIPNWSVRLVILLIVIGFPVALVLAWAYEITPEGVQRTEDVPPQQSMTRSTGRKLDFFIIAVLAVVIALLVIDRFRPRVGESTDKSIAVLPFANLSEDRSNAYFADGIQDEILTRLAKIGAIKVISRTSTQQFQSKPGSVSDIAKRLDVAHVLEGSVQKSGDSVRVNVQLIKANHDSHVWAETYDRRLTDLFAVESEIAQKIADSLAAHLTGKERTAISTVPTQNPEAYDSYLRALALLNRQGAGQLVEARGALQRAIALDPNYAQAWARLALTEAEIYFGGAAGEAEHTPAQLERARRVADTAMRLAPELSDSHLGLGSFYYYCLKDFDRALAELNEARKLAPNDAYVIFAIGLVKRRQGKLDEALKLQHEAAVLDPMNSDMWVNLARTYAARRDFIRSREMFDRAITLAPDERDIVAQKADTFVTEGKLDAAEATIANLEGAPSTDVFAMRVTIATLRRQFDRAIDLLQRAIAAPETPPLLRTFAWSILGQVQFAAADPAARASLERARSELGAIRDQGNTSADIAERFMLVAACLGDRATVERESDIVLSGEAKDKFHLPRTQMNIAAAFATLGDAKRAVPLIAAALAAPSDITPTPALLRIDPMWDRIRQDAGFQKLCSGGTP